MADEMTLTASLFARKDNTIAQLILERLSFDVSGSIMKNDRQKIGIVEELLDLGDVPSAGATLVIINRDPTNFVSILSGSGLAALVRLGPRPSGKPALFEIDAAATVFLIADLAPCEVEFALVEA